MIRTQVCIIGAGAGGIGCAYRLIKHGIKTVIVDKNPDYGGTMTFGGIDGWEPGVSLDGIHTLIKDQLLSMENGAHVVEVLPNLHLLDGEVDFDWDKHSFSERPWGYDHPLGGSYEDTLFRCNLVRGDRPQRRFQFDGELFIKAVKNIFAPFKESLTELFGYSYHSVEKAEGKITTVTVKRGEELIKIEADFFVDCSGDIVLARDAGCPYTIGTEGHEDYNEPSANERSDTVNAVTYAFRVTKSSENTHVDPLPEEIKNTDLGNWEREQMKKTVSLIVRYPDGDLHVNMLPTMQGDEYFALGDDADRVGRARVLKYWHFLQSEKGLSGYTVKRIYDAGIRESYRLIGKYVLKEQDLRSGILCQPKKGRTVAIADHNMDIHGKGGFNAALDLPYEIPIECCMSNEFDNLFVACRGASFTHIAGSSARLSRTILSMGEGVGEYISELLK